MTAGSQHHGGIAEVSNMVAAWAGVFVDGEAEFWQMLEERWLDPDGEVILQEFGDAIGVGRYIPGLQVAYIQQEVVPAADLLRRTDSGDELTAPFAARLRAVDLLEANAFVCLYDYVVWPHTDQHRGLVFLGNVSLPAASGLRAHGG